MCSPTAIGALGLPESEPPALTSMTLLGDDLGSHNRINWRPMMGVRQLEHARQISDESRSPKGKVTLDLLWSDRRLGVLAAVALAPPSDWSAPG